MESEAEKCGQSMVRLGHCAVSACPHLKLDGIPGQRKSKLVATKWTASAAVQLCRGREHTEESTQRHLRKYYGGFDVYGPQA